MREAPVGPMPLYNPTSFKLRCQCCQRVPQIMGEVIAGAIYLRFLQWNSALRQKDLHWLWLDAARLADLDTPQTWRCDCCIPEDGRWMAEFYEGHLVLRGRRHGRVHFVTLNREKIAEVLAAAAEAAYALQAELPCAPLLR